MERHPPSRSESQDIANKQEFVEGQRKEIDVKDYAEVQSLGQALKETWISHYQESNYNFCWATRPKKRIAIQT